MAFCHTGSFFCCWSRSSS